MSRKRTSTTAFLAVASMILLPIVIALGGTPYTVQADINACTTPVFINEFHYDNVGGDTGEFIEVAGPASTSLSNWSIVLHNGNGGAPYDTISLSGTIPDQDDGFGTLSFSRAGIQNGPQDAMALVNASDGVEQFLSYEGTLVAVGGPANGMTSADVGVSESTPPPVGQSLQLTGAGQCPDDFSWSSPSDDSSGSVNSGQSFTSGETA